MKYCVCLCTLCCDNFYRHSWSNNDMICAIFYNSRLFVSNLIKSIAKYFTMIKSDSCDRRNFSLADVCCVDTTAKSAFEYGYIYFLISELKKCNHSYDFEKSNLSIVFFCTLKYLRAIINNLLLRNHFIVYGNAFSKSTHMR